MDANLRHINLEDIIFWFRVKSKEYAEIANTLDKEVDPLNQSTAFSTLDDKNFLITQMHDILSKNKIRVSNLALIFKVDVRKLEKLLIKENGFEVNNRGWATSLRALELSENFSV